MVTIKEMQRRLDKAINSFDSDVEQVYKILEEEILDLVRNEQLFEGMDSDGGLIGVYSKRTEIMTQGQTGLGFPKKAGSPYNFSDSGETFKKFKLKGGTDSFQIINTSDNLKEFSDRTNIPISKLIRLTSQNQKIVEYNKILPQLRELIKRNIRKS